MFMASGTVLTDLSASLPLCFCGDIEYMRCVYRSQNCPNTFYCSGCNELNFNMYHYGFILNSVFSLSKRRQLLLVMDTKSRCPLALIIYWTCPRSLIFSSQECSLKTLCSFERGHTKASPLRVCSFFRGLIITPEGASEQWCWGENPGSRHSSQLTSISASLAKMREIDMLSESYRAAHKHSVLPQRLRRHDPWHSTPHAEPVLLSHWSQFDRKKKAKQITVKWRDVSLMKLATLLSSGSSL